MQVCNFDGERSDCFIAYLHRSLLHRSASYDCVPGAPCELVFPLVTTGKLIVKRDDRSARPYISFTAKVGKSDKLSRRVVCGSTFKVRLDA